MKAEVDITNQGVTVRIEDNVEVRAMQMPVNSAGQATGQPNSAVVQKPSGLEETREKDESGALQCVDVSDLVWMDPASPLGFIDFRLGRRRERSKAANPSPQCDEAVTIRGCYSMDCNPQLLTGRYVIFTENEQVGLLHVDIDAAFDGTEDWCTLVVLDTPDGSPCCSRYTVSQITMPPSLHKHLLRQSIKWYAGLIYNGLLEHPLGLSAKPSVIESAEMLVKQGYTPARLNTLINWLEWTCWGRDFGSERPSLQQLRRLAVEAKKVWGDGPDPEYLDDMFGLDGELGRLDTDGSDERQDPHPSGCPPKFVRIMQANKQARDLKKVGMAKADATPDAAGQGGRDPEHSAITEDAGCSSEVSTAINE